MFLLGYTHQYRIGFQRELGRNTALEVRYVGNMNYGGTDFQWNLNGSANWNIIENGFYNEFRLAQQNLRANIAAGRGNTFAYTGAPGTAPLPIFQAYFAGTPLSSAANQNAANYTSSNYSASAWYDSLRIYNPNLTGIAGTGPSGLQNSSRNANAIAAGLPANFFQVSPDVKEGSSWLKTMGGRTRRGRALSVGLQRSSRGPSLSLARAASCARRARNGALRCRDLPQLQRVLTAVIASPRGVDE